MLSACIHQDTANESIGLKYQTITQIWLIKIVELFGRTIDSWIIIHTVDQG